MTARNRLDDARPGDRIGFWTVLSEAAPRYACSARFVRCVCRCGREREVHVGSLRAGISKSCGCSTNARKHGLSKTPEYKLWQSMNSRCRNPKGESYVNYGGRGITVCQRWQDSFVAFLDDVGRRPSPELTLDRINNDGDYEPGNVRWTTRKVQAANCRLTPERRRAMGLHMAAKVWSSRQARSTSPST